MDPILSLKKTYFDVLAFSVFNTLPKIHIQYTIYFHSTQNLASL